MNWNSKWEGSGPSWITSSFFPGHSVASVSNHWNKHKTMHSHTCKPHCNVNEQRITGVWGVQTLTLITISFSIVKPSNSIVRISIVEYTFLVPTSNTVQHVLLDSHILPGATSFNNSNCWCQHAVSCRYQESELLTHERLCVSLQQLYCRSVFIREVIYVVRGNSQLLCCCWINYIVHIRHL